MTEKQILKELKKAKIDNVVYFIGILPSFIWDKTTQTVAPITSDPGPNNDLQLFQTEIIEFSGPLHKLFDEIKLHEKDVLVFCVNDDYLPKREGNFIRLKILQKALIKSPKGIT